MSEKSIEELATAAKKARKSVAPWSYEKRGELLLTIANGLEARSAEILAANQIDRQRAVSEMMSEPLLDRLTLTEPRIMAIANGVRKVANLADPLGVVRTKRKLANGLELKEITVPIGVVGMIYEARPNVTVDAATILLASGNAVLLRGSSSARETNQLLVEIMQAALKFCALPIDLIQLISSKDRQSVSDLLKARGYVDLVIPRGSASLIEMVVSQALVPTIETGAGICHIYLDKSADEMKALLIVVNAKVDRPSVCNAVETILIHKDRIDDLLPQVLTHLKNENVFFHLDNESSKVALDQGLKQGDDFLLATELNWQSEYGALEINIRVVSDIDDALAHIEKYGTHHTEAIITEDLIAAQHFISCSDSAAIMINASTRFTDGEAMGFGAEIGISTQKLHARGPMGLEAMTTTTWIVSGSGQIR